MVIAEELHLIARADGAIHHPEVGDDPPERIEYRVENQSLQRRILITFRRWYAVYYGIQHPVDPLPGLGAHRQYLLPLTAYELYNLV